MLHRRLWLLALGVCCAAAPIGRAADPSSSIDDARRLAGRIDQLIEVKLAKLRLTPAPLATESAQMRRLSLDVIGRIASVPEARRYLAEPGSDKYERELERMLGSPGYVNHFSNVWRELLLPEVGQDFEKAFLLPSMDGWLRKQFRDNVPYDKMVREVLTLPLGRPRRNPQEDFDGNYFGRFNQASPIAFYQAKEGKPEEIAAASARVFLGVRIECAQCHDHPFAKWTREQFWGQAAFFAGIRSRQNNGIYSPLNEVNDRREMAIPNDRRERVAQAQYLDGTEPQWRYKVNARETYADWVTAADNPFFARAFVNRLWAHFFGIGIVDPVDDLDHADHPPSHPELLDEMARAFVKSGYDMKFMIRAITLSKAYRRSSVARGPIAPDTRLFSHMSVRGLTPEQVFDSLVVATGYKDPFRDRRNRFFNPNSPRQMFTSKFQVGTEKPIEHRTSIPQALAMMNNGLIADLTNPDKGELLAAVAHASFMDPAAKVETIYLAALGRKPTTAESKKYVAYVERGGTTSNPKQALADVYWALLNSPEFILNH
jgi:hypothetical protein